MVKKVEINTIVFDIGNVLVDFRWKEYLSECGYSEEIVHKVSQATVLNPLWKRWDRGDVEDNLLIEEFCATEPQVAGEIRKLFGELSHVIREYDYSANLLKKLKAKGYQVYLLSNFGKNHFEMCKQDLKFMEYTDGGVISYEVFHVKPEPEIYETLINKYKINPQKTVFLDDLEENLEGARTFGFHLIQVKDYAQMVKDLHDLGVEI